MSFRQNLTSYENNSELNNLALKQGIRLKNNREGFTSFLDIDTKQSSKLQGWNQWFSNTFGSSGSSNQLSSTMQKYRYHADKYAKHYGKLSEELKRCREACVTPDPSTSTVPPNGAACQAGCNIAFPRYAVATNTYHRRKDIDGNLIPGTPSCASISNNICNNGAVLSSLTDNQREILNTLGNDAITTPQTGCTVCGGGILGKPVFRDEGTNSIVESCDFYSSDTNKKTRCDEGKNKWNPQYNSMTDDEFPQGIGMADGGGETERTLKERYDLMVTANANMDNAIGNVKSNFKTMDDFVKKITNNLSSKDSETTTDLTSLKATLDNYLSSLALYDTYSGRFEDSMLKKESQLYKNWAWGILAISLFTVAMYKIRKMQ